MTNCIICKKFGNEHTHPTSACITFHGVSGNSGRIANSKVPQEYRFVTVEDLEFKKEMFQAYANSFRKMFDQILSTKDRIKSLYLFSKETGTGKTSTACSLLNEFNITHVLLSWSKGLTPMDSAAFFLDTNELQELYNQFNRQGIPQDVREGASREYYRRLKNAKESLLVVFDDIGVRSATEGFRGDIHTVINHRVVQQLPTIYTSNLPLEDMVTVYDQRLYDRMRDLTVQVEFTGLSKRGLR